MLLLISFYVARERRVSVVSAIVKSATAALVVVATGQAMGARLPQLLHG